MRTKKVLLLLNAAEAKRENEKKQAGKKKRKERRRNMGNCLAPFQLTGQSNLFHVMALFTWPDKATCKASELIYVDEIDQEIPNLCLQTSVHI